MTTQTAPTRRFKIPFKLKALTTAGIAAYGCYHFQYNPLPDVIALVKYAVDRDASILSAFSEPEKVERITEIEYREIERNRYIIAFENIESAVEIDDTVYARLKGDIQGFACLVKNLYHEARESVDEQIHVGLTTLNRLESDLFPNDMCGVVYQDNQFAWTNDGLPDNMTDTLGLDQSIAVAKSILRGEEDRQNVGQMYFYNPAKSKSVWFRTAEANGEIERIGTPSVCAGGLCKPRGDSGHYHVYYR